MIFYENAKRYSGTSKSKRPGLCRSICCRGDRVFLVFSFGKNIATTSCKV